MTQHNRCVAWLRWLKFNAVGGVGVGVQLAVLAGLKSGLHLNYLPAAALAVEAAVVHNFFWHEQFTWADRTGNRRLARLFKFNLTTGLISILGNVALMALFSGALGMPYIAANLAAIIVCSLANFVASDRLVFQQTASSKNKTAGPTPCRLCQNPELTSRG